MSSILSCPACQQSVSLPAGRVALVQCPHCHSGIALEAQVAPLAPRIETSRPRPADNATPRRPTANSTPSTAADYRQRQGAPGNHPSAVGQLVGILAGGVLGVALGYWLLNYFGGARYDFLHVPLPLVAHTQSSDVAEAAPVVPSVAPSVTPSAVVATPPVSAAAAPAMEPIPPEAPTSMTPGNPAIAMPQGGVEFPRYNSADLGESLAAAHAAVGCPHCKSTGFVNEVEVTGVTQLGERQIERKARRRVPCEHCDGKPTGRITADVFARLCQLSQVVTFVEIEPGDPQLVHRKEAVEQVLLRAASDQAKQNALGRLAGYHLAETSRATSGVLLAGTVQSIDRQGRLFTTRLVLFGLPEVVTVVSTARPPLKATDKVLVAGSIIDQPRDKLLEYEGTLPQIVWGGLPVKLPGDNP